MKKLFYLVVTLFFGNSNNVYTQTNNSKYDNAWILGYCGECGDSGYGGTRLTFNSDTLQIDTVHTRAGMYLTNASICDRHGNLQFYTEGFRIYNKNHELMPQGDTLCPGDYYNYYATSSSGGTVYTDGGIIYQGAIILPSFQDSNIYRVLHERLFFPPLELGRVDLLYCTTVDMSKNNGLGGIKSKSKIVIQQDSLANGKLTACRHANGQDWWVLVPSYKSNSYRRILVTSDSVQLLSRQSIGKATPLAGGQACFSPNGCYYVRYGGTSIIGNIGVPNDLDIYNFDRSTGLLSNPVKINFVDSAYCFGVAISPNSRFLYASSLYFVYQFDLWASDIAASKITVATYDGFIDPLWVYGKTAFSIAQLAPDGKIYISAPGGNHYIHVIEYPDRSGLACELRQHTIRLPRYYLRAMPNFPNYRLGALQASDSCPSLISASSDAPAEAPLGLVIQPNPATDLLHIAYHTENTTALTVAISDYTGKKIQTLSLDPASGSLDINTSALPNGLYLCTLYDSATHRQQSVKFVVMR